MLVVPNANSATWVVDLPAGSKVTVVVRDATGEMASSSPFVVGAGSDECFEQGLVL